jgi:hypothetical protein
LGREAFRENASRHPAAENIPRGLAVVFFGKYPSCRLLPNRLWTFKRGHLERWPSGLRRTLGKRVCGKPYRGFESHSLRQRGRSRLSKSAEFFDPDVGSSNGSLKLTRATIEIVSSSVSPFNIPGITGDPISRGIRTRLPWRTGFKGYSGGQFDPDWSRPEKNLTGNDFIKGTLRQHVLLD